MRLQTTWRAEDGTRLASTVWRAGPGMRMISSAMVGGGIGPGGWVLNAQVAGDYARLDPVGHLRELAAASGLRGPGVGMLTAAAVDRTARGADGGVQAAATVGLRVPTWAAAPPGALDPELAPISDPRPAPAVHPAPTAGADLGGRDDRTGLFSSVTPRPAPSGGTQLGRDRRAEPVSSGGAKPAQGGAEMGQSGPVAPRGGAGAAPGGGAHGGAGTLPPWKPGTVNVVVEVPAALSDAALVNAVVTATEAKTQALLEAGYACTGTASDAICIAAPIRGAGEAEPFAGPRSIWGARIARAVHAAVHAGALDYSRWLKNRDEERS
ncbi:adenosylcobinamide amidohydrolase [Spirillospora sp. CA-255316]